MNSRTLMLVLILDLKLAIWPSIPILYTSAGANSQMHLDPFSALHLMGFVPDRRDRGAEESVPEKAGGWDPEPGFEGDPSPARD